MSERYLPFLEEADILQVTHKSNIELAIEELASRLYSTYFVLSTLGSTSTRCVLGSANQQ